MSLVSRIAAVLSEMSFTDKDIPRKFFVALYANAGRNSDEKFSTVDMLLTGELKGVTGISASGDIIWTFFGSGRPFLLVMDGPETVRLNKLSRVMYDNPDYLVSKDMAMLQRIWSGTPKDNPHAGEKLNGYFKKAIAGDKSEFGRNASHILGYYGISFYRMNVPYIKDMKDLAKLFREAVLALWNRKESIPPDAAKEIFEKEPLSTWIKYMREAIRLAARVYHDEGEWIVKDKSLKIPRGSTIVVPTRKATDTWSKMSDAEVDQEIEKFGEYGASAAERDRREFVKQISRLRAGGFKVTEIDGVEWEQSKKGNIGVKRMERNFKR